MCLILQGVKESAKVWAVSTPFLCFHAHKRKRGSSGLQFLIQRGGSFLDIFFSTGRQHLHLQCDPYHILLGGGSRQKWVEAGFNPGLYGIKFNEMSGLQVF